MYRESKPLTLFLHMPKCAGTSIRTQLEKYPDKIKIVNLYNNLNVEGIKNLCNTEALNADVWFGHFWFGIHNYIPRDVRYITLLRAPRDYIISQYFFRKYTLCENCFVDSSSIFEAIGKCPVFFYNTFTRYLAGIPENVLVNESAVEQAIHNIDNFFEYVGFNEKMKDSCDFLSQYFDVAIENYIMNDRATEAHSEVIDEGKFMDFIHGFIRHDLNVYYFAKGRFDVK